MFRLKPEQQKEAVSQLAAGDIHSMDQYYPAQSEPKKSPSPKPEPPASPAVPYTLGSKHYASLEKSTADLKNPDKGCSYTPDTLSADIDGFVNTFHKNFAWYSNPFCTVVFPHISKVQFEFVRQRFSSISSAMEGAKEALIKSTCADLRQEFLLARKKSAGIRGVCQTFLTLSSGNLWRKDAHGDLISGSLTSTFLIHVSGSAAQ